MRIFILTSDKYMKILPASAYLLNKYWPDQEFVVCGFSEPEFELPENFLFYVVGPQASYPFSRWSDGLIAVLRAFPKEKYPIIFLDDYLVCKPVRADIIRMALDYMEQFSGFCLKFDIAADRRFAAGATPYGTLGDIPLVKSDYNSQYHSSLMPGIWNRELLLRYLLVPGESPHDFELSGTPRLARYGDEVIVVGTVTDPWPITITLGFRSLNPDGWMLEGLDPEDLAELRARNLVP